MTKKTIVSTNWLNKVMAAVAVMTLTMTMPAMAGNKKHNDRRADKVVVAVKDKKAPSHFDAARGPFDRRPMAPRPEVKVCTFKVSRHAAAHRNVEAKA